MKHLFYTILFTMCCLFNCTLLFSQTTYNQCGTDEIHHYLMAHDTTYASKINSVERKLQQFQNNNNNLRLLSDTVLTIPVVVHIIHTNNANGQIDNPTDQQVIDMITELNKTYRATSTTYPNVSNGGVDTKIQFVLAKRTPTCGATNGILRVYAGNISKYINGGVQYGYPYDSSRCGISVDHMKILSPLWPSESYYNLYLVRGVCGAGAFAYFGSFAVCPSNGYALPHETGHYLYLYHTFDGQTGTGTICPPNANCSQDGDLVCDTDPHLSTGGLSTAINICTGRVFGNIVKNFMSYSQQLLFTQGQKTRMRNILESSSISLISSYGSFAPSTITPTCSIAQIRGTNPFCSDSSVQFKVTYSSNVGTNPTILWYLNNNPYTYGEIITVYGSSINNNDIISCRVTSNNTCSNPNPAVSNQITLKKSISATPTIQISSQNIFSSYYICKDSAVTFNVIVTHGGTSPKYQWKKNNVNIGTNSPTFTSTTLANGDNITCTLTSNETCISTNNVISNNVYIYRYPDYNPNITISIQNNLPPLICEGSTVTFKATATNISVIPNYQWILNGNNITGANNTTYTTNNLRNNDIITCLLTSNDRCVLNKNKLSNAIKIKVKTKVTPTLSIQNLTNNDSACVGEIVKLKAIPANTGTPTFLWYSTYNSTKDTISDIITAYSKTYYCSVRIDTANYCSTTPTVTATRRIYGEIKPAKPTITLISNYLKSNSTIGNQWYSVATGKIVGAINQTFYPVSNGKYYTVVTKNRCSSLPSDTIFINNITTGINDNWNDNESKIKIIPNPNSGSFKIELNEKINENVSVLIYNILGEQLYSKTFKRIYDNEINIQSDIISNGLYNVVIRTKENLYSKKIEIIK